VDGKREIYIKDEESFNDFIIRRISDREKVALDNGEVISGKRLSTVLKNLIKYYDHVNELVRRGYSERFIEFLGSYGVKGRDPYKDREFMGGLLEKLQESGFIVNDLQMSEDGHGYYEFVISETRNGGQSFGVDWQLFTSPELKRIIEISQQLHDLRGRSFEIGGDGKAFTGWQKLLENLMNQGKSGLTIQRYKGLGEMNPSQLWDTTMDPEKRTLLKVRVEDVVEADGIFTVLMGDEVEPRREFIYNNALEVKELDI
jgi:DNA gyrase subunit B